MHNTITLQQLETRRKFLVQLRDNSITNAEHHTAVSRLEEVNHLIKIINTNERDINVPIEEFSYA